MDTKLVRRRLASILLVTAIVLVIAGLLTLSMVSRNSLEFAQLYPTILLINIVGAVVLLLLIGANLLRLYREHRANIPGARLKVRLVTAFIILVIVPVAVVYAYSIQFLSEGIDAWFDIRVEQGLGDALELSRAALDVRVRDDLDKTRRIADALYSVSDNDVYQYLPGLRSESGARDVTVFAGGSRIVATSSSTGTEQLPLLPSEEMLLSLRREGYYSGYEVRAEDEQTYLTRTAVLMPGRYGRDIRIVQAIYPLGQRLGPLANSVENTVSRYTELAFLRAPLRSSLVMTLSMVVLISLLLAVYGAFFFTRRLTAPVQILAEGTRAVARGDFDTRLPSGKHDEIGFLIDSFNDMIGQLASTRAEAQSYALQVETERSNLETILARLSTGVIALEHNMTLRTANAAAGTILGHDFRDREGSSMLRMAENDPTLQQFMSFCQERFQCDDAEWREQLMLDTEDGRRTLVCASSALPGSYRNPGGFVVVFDDITELLRVQRDAAWGEVARRLAHEIKNPLTPIKLSAERIRHRFLGVLPDRDAELLDRATQTIVRQVEAMRDMVNAFSEYARAPQMNRAAIDLNRLISQVADLYPAHHSLAFVRLELDPKLPLVSVDAVRIRQVLHNLIRNSLEALEDSARPEIVVSTRLRQGKQGPRVEITVHDNGPGFPLEDREKIFEPYVTTKSKGTGLGLAIVRKLVDEHSGQVHIDSGPGEGATVRIVLPIHDAKTNDRQAGDAKMRLRTDGTHV